MVFRRRASARTVLCALVMASAPFAVCAQTVRPDTLWLDDLQRAAERLDRRNSQLSIASAQSALRLQNIRSEQLPTVTAYGTAQYLSDVARIGAVLPGLSIPSPRNDQYDTYLSVRQPLHDPTRRARMVVDEAQTRETQSRSRTNTFQQRTAVSDAFFGAVLRDAQVRSLDVAITDLESRIAVATRRVSSGVALPSEQLLLVAELERRRQTRDELVSERDAAREVLSTLVDAPITAGTTLMVRAVTIPEVFDVRVADTLRARPEFAQFERSRELVEARRAATRAQDLPKLSAFGRTGYGRPGLNALGREFAGYWTAGIQAEWPALNWGRTRREAEAQQLQREIVAADEAAFRESLHRAVIGERARINALERTLQYDDSIVTLRERILRETRLRHDEGEVNAADYVSRLAEHLSAQLDRDTHRVRLAESRARYLTTLGLEVR
jgi:outer membrane protein TolC